MSQLRLENFTISLDDFGDGPHQDLNKPLGLGEMAMQGLRAIEPLAAPTEQIAFGKHAAYLHCANGILESKAGKALVGKIGKAATTRNWATVLKLQALANEGA